MMLKALIICLVGFGIAGLYLYLCSLDGIRRLIKENKMDMNKRTAKLFLESMLSAYRASNVVSSDNSKYRMIWVSESDAKALEMAIEEMEDGNDKN